MKHCVPLSQSNFLFNGMVPGLAGRRRDGGGCLDQQDDDSGISRACRWPFPSWISLFGDMSSSSATHGIVDVEL